MNSMRLTERDRQLRHILIHMGVAVFPEQLAWFWGRSVKPVTKRLEQLRAAGILDAIKVAVRVSPLLLEPRLVCPAGQTHGNVKNASYASRQLWLQCPTTSRTAYTASRASLAAFGVKKPISAIKLAHDAAVTQVAMTYVLERPDEWPLFRHESCLDSLRIGATMPDAALVDAETGTVIRAIEVCSGYRADTLQRKVNACSQAGIEIEIWG